MAKRVFVTGATGFVGTAVVAELVSHGHSVLGLTRGETGAASLKAAGADSVMGTLDNLDLLKKTASEVDDVLHLAFVHDFTKYAESCATDRAAITALGDGLIAGGKHGHLVITSGTLMIPNDGDEDSARDTVNPMASARGQSEELCHSYADKGLKTAVVRLAPTTHGPGSSGFTGMLVKAALDNGFSAYIGDGANRWGACHRDDAAKIYRLALDKDTPKATYHGITENAVPVKDIISRIGKELGVEVKSITPEEAAEHFGWFARLASTDHVVQSEKTRKRLGWTPTMPSVVESVKPTIDYVKAHPNVF